jgi:hypothetical protein
MKEISLSRGLVTVVDDEDYARFSAFSWTATPGKGTFYAYRRVGAGPRKNVWLHREIAGTPEGMKTDHCNGDGLDNRRSNLRICTHVENCRNLQRVRAHSSVYKGVSWQDRKRHWKASLRLDGRFVYLGSFMTEEEAVHAYDVAALELFGEFAQLNFPAQSRVEL